LYSVCERAWGWDDCRRSPPSDEEAANMSERSGDKVAVRLSGSNTYSTHEKNEAAEDRVMRGLELGMGCCEREIAPHTVHVTARAAPHKLCVAGAEEHHQAVIQLCTQT
jgi:hypothetical protein